MQIDLNQLFLDTPILLTFFVIGCGYLIARLRLGSVRVGATTGVLLAGLIFGHLGFPDRPEAATFGFTLFIFSVGLQAGPSFFSVFMEDGLKYFALSAVVVLTSVTMASGLSLFFDFEFGLNAGLLAGALTSTPTLAGAQDAITSGLAALPGGMTAATASDNVSVAYAITYIFGTMGLILLMHYLPAALRIDLAKEARELANQRGLGARKDRLDAGSIPIIRAYRVGAGAEIIGGRLQDLQAGRSGRFLPLGIRRGDELLEAVPDLTLQEGDVVSLIARLSDHQLIQENVGNEVLDPELLNYQITMHEIVVISPGVANQPLKTLEVTERHGCFVTGVSRAGIDLPMDENLVLNKGDRLHVTGEAVRLEKLALQIGHIEERVEETDLMTTAFGVCAGVLLGLVVVKVGQVSVGLGSAGGLLLMGILIGFLSSLHPTFGRVPAAARFILMELGLMLFMTSVGLKAGGGILEAMVTFGPRLIFCGVLVTTVPVLVGYAFGRRFLDLNPALLLGSITGAMTSTPALNIVSTAARSPVPSLGYAGTYTFSNVMLTFAGTLMMTT